MDLNTNEVFRDISEEQEREGRFARIPKEYDAAVHALLNGKDRAVADDTTKEGRELLEFAKKARRKKQKNARRARRKARRRK